MKQQDKEHETNMFKSIRSTFLFYIIIAVVAIMMVSYFFVTKYTESIIDRNVEEIIRSTQNEKKNLVEEITGDIYDVSSGLAAVVENTRGEYSISTFELLLKAAMESNKGIHGVGIWYAPYAYDEDIEYASIYIMNKDGETIATSDYFNEEYNYMEKPYYVGALNAKDTFYTDVFFGGISQTYLICFSTPIFDENGDFIGCVSADITLEYMNEMIKNTGEASKNTDIINSQGIFMWDEDLENVIQMKNIADSDNESYVEAIQKMVDKEMGYETYLVDGEPWRMYYSNVGTQNWTIVSTISEAEMFTDIHYFTRFYSIISVILALIIVVIVVVILNKTTTKPINLLLMEMNLAGERKGKVSITKKLTSRKDEFGTLSYGFLRMLGELNEYQATLEERNSTLTEYVAELEYRNTHDHLTGLFNREQCIKKWEQYIGEKTFPLSVIVADINGMKLINYSFGNEIGDKILIGSAEIFRNVQKESKNAFRYGGDDFIILLPETDKQEAEKIVQQIKQQLSVKTVGIAGLTLSAEFGVGTLYNDKKDFKEIVRNAEEELERNRSKNAIGERDKTIDLIVSTLQEKNPREQLHSNRVASICEQMAKTLNMTVEEKMTMKTAGLLHDIGKIGIHESVLNKPGKLTDEEFAEIKKHPEIGHRILLAAGNMEDIAEYAYSHHERWDGKGYPRQLKGEEIPYMSRILAIADTYDAMTSDRSYRKGMESEKAIEEIKKCAGTQFDPELVNVFEKAYAKIS